LYEWVDHDVEGNVREARTAAPTDSCRVFWGMTDPDQADEPCGEFL